ncbi:thioesterase [Pseudovibrio japonicus]|uniref:Thioesterase n=1 Tax=Pseudovibrio japonicus TaxID=366534 RepID=A0ABQ3EGX6_9HYPH|nr:PaaI family thioesterase [Pseudovibrio japonicus]GHB36411.1 thioesterase [Pseudovibrio japonicus]
MASEVAAPAAQVSPAELTEYLDKIFPQMHAQGRAFFIDEILPGKAIVRLKAGDSHLRPGGTVSGPSLMGLADYAAYVVLMGNIGLHALAVTTNMNINFLRKAEAGDMIATCRILKGGKRLVVMDCEIVREGSDDLIAHATATYSIPPASFKG